jgi:hypothetical protein
MTQVTEYCERSIRKNVRDRQIERSDPCAFFTESSSLDSHRYNNHSSRRAASQFARQLAMRPFARHQREEWAQTVNRPQVVDGKT